MPLKTTAPTITRWHKMAVHSAGSRYTARSKKMAQ
jgi:hypothetical protein